MDGGTHRTLLRKGYEAAQQNGQEEAGDQGGVAVEVSVEPIKSVEQLKLERNLQTGDICSCVTCHECCSLFGMLCVGCGTVPCHRRRLEQDEQEENPQQQQQQQADPSLLNQAKQLQSQPQKLQLQQQSRQHQNHRAASSVLVPPSQDQLEAQLALVCGDFLRDLVEELLGLSKPNTCLGSDADAVNFYFNAEAVDLLGWSS